MSTGQTTAVEWMTLAQLAALWETTEPLAMKRVRQLGLKWFDASTRKDKPKPMFRRIDVDAVMFAQSRGETPEQTTDDDPTAVEPPAEGPPPYVRPDFDPFGKGKAKR